jgi:hypothetical protein
MFVILLTVILVTPEGMEDISSSRQVATIEDCMSAAKEWLAQDPHQAGGIGVAAMCQMVDRPKS